jgi:hypothetical protein
MRKDLWIEGLGDLVERPIESTLASYRAGGSILLSPGWHEWRDGGSTSHRARRRESPSRAAVRPG